MQNSHLVSQAEQLDALYKQGLQGRFPYDDIRELFRKAGNAYEGFIPDLDLYFSTIVGYCSWGKRILNWNTSSGKKHLRIQVKAFSTAIRNTDRCCRSSRTPISAGDSIVSTRCAPPSYVC